LSDGDSIAVTAIFIFSSDFDIELSEQFCTLESKLRFDLSANRKIFFDFFHGILGSYLWLFESVDIDDEFAEVLVCLTVAFIANNKK